MSRFRKIEIKELPAVDGPPVVVFEPRTLNLLAIIDAKLDTNVVNAEIEKDAAWSLGGGELTSPAIGQGVAEFPYIPPDEYDFRIEFTCLGGLPEINQFLARRDRSFSCMLGAGAEGTKFGLQMIGGLNVAENTTGVDRPRMTLNEPMPALSTFATIRSAPNWTATNSSAGKQIIATLAWITPLSNIGRWPGATATCLPSGPTARRPFFTRPRSSRFPATEDFRVPMTRRSGAANGKLAGPHLRSYRTRGPAGSRSSMART